MIELPRESLEDLEVIDDDRNLRRYRYAEWVAEQLDVAATEDDTVFVHDGRVWRARGEQILKDEMTAHLEEYATEHNLKEVVSNIRRITRTPRAELFDLPPRKIVVKNGVVDLIDGEFTPLEAVEPPGTQVYIDIEYVPEAVPVNFWTFLAEVLSSNDIDIMWEMIAHCLYRGYPFQKAFMLLGDGANGKSTLLAALREFLGEENVTSIELHKLASNRFHAAELDGKLANLAPDISEKGLRQSGMFKALTGGDTITAERKYEDPFEFENTATLIFSGNSVPSVEDGTNAYSRRWHYFEFPNKFDDGVPQEELLSQFRDEHPGMLNEALRAFRRLWERGEFEPTTYMNRHGDDVHEVSTESAIEFITEHFVEDNEDHVRIADAYDAYTSWADENGHDAYDRRKFENLVRSHLNPEKSKDPMNANYRIWDGFRLGNET